MSNLSLKWGLPLVMFLSLSVFLWQVLGKQLNTFAFAEMEKKLSVSNLTIFSFDVTQQKGSDLYVFNTVDEAALFNKLSHALRCLLCQNQSLADSRAPQALSLRYEIYQAIKQGKSESEVLDFITQRYGETILFQPPFRWGTLFLWLGPGAMVLGVALFFIRQFKK